MQRQAIPIDSANYKKHLNVHVRIQDRRKTPHSRGHSRQQFEKGCTNEKANSIDRVSWDEDSGSDEHEDDIIPRAVNNCYFELVYYDYSINVANVDDYDSLVNVFDLDKASSMDQSLELDVEQDYDAVESSHEIDKYESDQELVVEVAKKRSMPQEAVLEYQGFENATALSYVEQDPVSILV